MKKRIGYFDIAKCVAILFIVIGHTGLIYGPGIPGGMPSKIVHFAFTFHLPVFFVASGYFFKTEQMLDGRFFSKSWRAILLPYVVTCLLIVAGCVVMAFFQEGSMKQAAVTWFGASLYGAGAPSPLSFVAVERIGGIWFLLALFWAQIVVAAAAKLPKPGLWIACLFVLGWLSARYVMLPWSVQSGLCASLFVYAGTLARKHAVFERVGRAPTAAFVVCLLVWAVYVVGPFGDMSFAVFVLPQGLFDLVGSFCAAYVVFVVCRAFEHRAPQRLSSAFEFVGRNTLAVFCIHIFEDDVLAPVWAQLIDALSEALPVGGWVAFLLIRLAVIGLLCVLAYRIPWLASVYFPSKRTSAVGAVQRPASS